MDFEPEIDCEIRVEGKFYMPDPGEIILYVCRHDARPLCIAVTEHDGSEESLRSMNSALRTWADRRYRCMSPIQSCTYYRTEDGDFGVVSDNGKYIAPLDSVRGRCILGDPDAIHEIYGS